MSNTDSMTPADSEKPCQQAAFSLKERLAYIQNLLQKNHALDHTHAAQQSIMIIETAFRELLLRELPRLEANDQQRIQELINKKITKRATGIRNFTFGTLIGIIRDGRFFEAYSHATGRSLTDFDLLNFNVLNNLRNQRLVHLADFAALQDPNNQVSLATAKVLYAYTCSLLEFFDIKTLENLPPTIHPKWLAIQPILVGAAVLVGAGIVIGISLLIQQLKSPEEPQNPSPITSNVQSAKHDMQPKVLEREKPDLPRLELSGNDAQEQETHLINFEPPNTIRWAQLINNSDEPLSYQETGFPRKHFYLTLWDANSLVPARDKLDFRMILTADFPEKTEYSFSLNHGNQSLKITIRLSGDWQGYWQQKLKTVRQKLPPDPSPQAYYNAAKTVLAAQQAELPEALSDALTGNFLRYAGQPQAAAIAYYHSEQERS